MLNLRSLAAALALAALLAPAVYAASSAKTFTVTNSGSGPLTITGAAISGNPAEYALTPGGCATPVAVGGNCSFTVTFTPTGVGARTPATLNFSSNGTNGPTHSISLAGAGAPSEITRTISASTSDVNMAALFGNPTAAGTYVLTVNSGVYVTATSTATAALSTGSFPAGSVVRIVNNGYIVGKGGTGGNGATAPASTTVPFNTAVFGHGSSGLAGGAAIAATVPLAVSNAGYIFGGGGGGGGGGSYASRSIMSSLSISGGGGGGGAGNGYFGSGGASATPGSNGTAGSTTGGSGGAGGLVVVFTTTVFGGAGGTGGDYGQPGLSGTDAYSGPGTGAAGGAAGKAVITNGNTITWLGGDNATQVKGAVQ